MTVEGLRAALHNAIDVRAANEVDAERASREHDALKWIVKGELRDCPRFDSRDVVNLPCKNIGA
jgi:hypothetical protein